jgi:outer membrane protein assembly factor BamD (BamD/ComL family)
VKYASDKQPQALETIKEAYDKLDMPDKAKAIQERIDKARQDAMMEQIQQQMQMQQQQGGAAGGTSMPITIPPPQ